MNDPRRGPPPKPHEGKKGCCCWCGDPVPKGRRNWCGDKRVNEYLAQTPGARRSAVFARDRGVCAKCGRDCEALQARMQKLVAVFFDRRDNQAQIRACRLLRLFVRLGAMSGLTVTRTLWEADHIVPICEGGSNALDNLRTLCLCCHKGETRALAKRRAERRRPQLPLPGVTP